MAATHFNRNLHRDVKKNSDGSEQMSVCYSKFKSGEATVKTLKVIQNFGKYKPKTKLVQEAHA